MGMRGWVGRGEELLGFEPQKLGPIFLSLSFAFKKES